MAVLGLALKYLIQLFAVGAIYFVVVRSSLELAAVYPAVPAIWPPAGFALAAVLLGGYRIAPGILVGGYFAHTGLSEPSYPAALIGTGNAFEAFLGAFLVNWVAGGRNAFTTAAGVAKFVLVALFVAAISASVGSSITFGPELPTGVEQIDWEKFHSIWFPWWLSDLAALLMITPALVLWVTERPRSFHLRRFLESFVIVAMASAFGVAAVAPFPIDVPTTAPLAILAVLLSIWAALRGGPRDTATVALILLAFAIWEGVFRGGALARSLPDEPLTVIIVFLIGITTPSLVLAADAVQRWRAERILRDTRKELGLAREQFAQSQKLQAVGQLTGGVAHDFNNLLTIIVGNLNMAQRHLESMTEASAERLRRVINNAMRGAERATTITSQLLAFSRKEPFDPKPLNINRLAQGLSDFLRRSLGETIILEIRGDDGLWQAQADPVQLETALINLAVNARDAMPPGGKLTIATENSVLDDKYCQQHDELVAGPYVRITVTDTGAGMSKDILKRVFEPFFTTKQAGHGTGLGLSQVYGFVKESNGHVEIDSNPGRGTTVTLYLPALPGDVPHEQTAQPERPDTGSVPTILVVEDDHDVRAYVVEILRELHYRVLDAHDAESALAMIDRDNVSIDLLVTDLVLPGMNGARLARELKGRQQKVKLLFVTGYSRETTHHWSADSKIDILYKPLTQEALEQKIRAVLNQPC
jgi:signal transduction histidine kinase/CheY-like chemotaxis protein